MTADSCTGAADTPEAGGGPQSQALADPDEDSALNSVFILQPISLRSNHTNGSLSSSRHANAGPEPPQEDEVSDNMEHGDYEWKESFEDQCQVWKEAMQEQIKEMREAVNNEASEEQLQALVEKNLEHYRMYYEEKKAAAREDIVEVMLGKWRSPLETIFLWIGGWRPSMVISLAYSKSSQHSEEETHSFLSRINSTSIVDLTAAQLQAISNKQEEVKKREDSLSEKLAVLQTALADEPILSLAEKDQVHNPEASYDDDEGESDGLKALEEAMDDKLKGLADLLLEADGLRLATLTEVVSLLIPLQAAQYLLAAADLSQAIHKIGKMKMHIHDHITEVST